MSLIFSMAELSRPEPPRYVRPAVADPATAALWLATSLRLSFANPERSAWCLQTATRLLFLRWLVDRGEVQS